MYKRLGIFKKAQRGDLLIDALIAMLICAVIGLGMTLGIANSLKTQALVDAQNTALWQMRNSIAQIGIVNICAGSSVPAVVLRNNVSLPVTAACTSQAVTVVAYSTTVQTVVLSVTSQQYFGNPGTIKTTA